MQVKVPFYLSIQMKGLRDHSKDHGKLPLKNRTRLVSVVKTFTLGIVGQIFDETI